MSGDWPDRWDDAFVPSYATPDLFVAGGQDCTVRDVDGTPYLDFLAGLAVASTGHCHPHVVEAIRDQARRGLHHSNLYGMPGAVDLAERLRDRTGLDRAFLCNSGSEANELALKAVRKAVHADGGDPEVLAFEDGFHGRTLGALTLTGQPDYHDGFGPMVPGISYAPFNDTDALKQAFESDPPDAVFYEPVQGEGGIVPMAPAFAETLGDLADDHGTVLVADEVQTGVHRTGPFLASTDLGLEPDVVTLAKGLGSGVPVGATLLDEELADGFAPGDHGCTFGGGPLAAAAANATLDVVASEDLGHRATKMGELLRDGLDDLFDGVRSRGLLLAGLTEDKDPSEIQDAAQDEGLLVGSIGDDVVRVSPPLVVTASEVELGLDRLEAALASV